MLHFLRRVRKNLLSQNRFTKYLLYAIGEIILVVIGILIALQINNWNEQKNQKQKLNSYLIALKGELEENLTRLDLAANRSKNDLLRTVNTIKITNSDSAKYFTSKDIYELKKDESPIFKVELSSAVYKDLINSGVLKDLKDRDLKTNIFKIERYFENYNELIDNAKKIWDNYLIPYYHKHQNVTNIWDSIEYVALPKLSFENDVSAFVNNRDYANILASRARSVANVEQYAKYLITTYEELINDINNYLDD